VRQQSKCTDRVRLTLVPVDLTDNDEHRCVRCDPKAGADSRRGLGWHRRRRVPQRVEADTGHVHEAWTGDDPMPTSRRFVLVVDDDQPVGPSPGKALGSEERSVRDRVAGLVKVEPVGGVRNGRSSVDRHPTDDVPR
jgi:hypothetical protein